jgi:hypothetical protein
LSREFGNSNLYSSLLEHFDNDFIRSQLHDSTNLNLFNDDLIGRIVSKVYGLTRSELEAIPVSVLFHLLSHHLLIISTEDDLFSYISSHLCSDPEYLDLLPFVRFEYLSRESVSAFLSALPEWIDRRLWESISPRLMPRIEIECPFKDDDVLDGIILYLTRKHGGNVHDNGIVTVTAKSVRDDGYTLRNVVHITSLWGFYSKNEPGQWICWDFHEMRVRLTHYTIASASPFLDSWVLEGSLDSIDWTEIDRKTGHEDFCGGSGIVSCPVSNLAECRFIRLTQTRKSYGSSDSLEIRALEFFGTFTE